MIWLIGKSGLLGQEVELMLKEKNFSYVASGHETDITDFDNLKDFSKNKQINWIINCAAYTAVDKAEEDSENAFKLNHHAVCNIIKIATEKNAKSRKLYLSDYALDKEGNITNIKNNSFKIAYKHRYLINAPFKISNKCCDYLKKYPMADYEKITGKKAIIGTQAEESKMRESAYLQTGCNNFKGGKSNPLGFWRSQDILEYIYKYNIEIASIYGEVKIDKDGKYYTTGEQRTGCCMCLFGCSLWKTNKENRVLRLEKTHPKLHNHMINNLGFKEVLEYMNIKYTTKDIDTEKEKSKLGNEDVEQFKWII
jgi:3'-phosphoadenosine 5'-phosphosulfate sulfotransferase (PAPS reductase)/FAD synthetase